MKTFLISLCVLIYATCELEALSCKQIRAFVDGHNIRRLKVAKGEIRNQPAASNMKFMIWDNELAAKAEQWAAQNRQLHNPDKSVLEALSCNQIQAFVDGHNLRRSKVAKGEIMGQPPAFDMKFMVWDDELAAKAAFWATQNHHFHNPDKSIPSGRFETGENLFEYSTTDMNYELDVEEVLESWFNEYKNYFYRPILNSDFDVDENAQIGHYTQMIWSDTLYVGCAVSQTIEGEWNKFFVVCNYGPSGNYIGKLPYKVGFGNSALICDCEEQDTNCYCNNPYGFRC